HPSLTDSSHSSILPQNPSASIEKIPDGSSNTIIFAEKYSSCNGSNFFWGTTTPNPAGTVLVSGFYNVNLPQPQPPFNGTGPGGITCVPLLLQAPWSGGINVGLADGSVRFVSNGVSLGTATAPGTWPCAIWPADKTPLGADW
ncbi:MAG TPA: H-X9-DG-CTERM domain-containing protein, partial [Urbifossiella sp.]